MSAVVYSSKVLDMSSREAMLALTEVIKELLVSAHCGHCGGSGYRIKEEVLSPFLTLPRGLEDFADAETSLDLTPKVHRIKYPCEWCMTKDMILKHLGGTSPPTSR